MCSCFWCSVFPYFIFQTNTSTGLSKGVSAQCLFDLLVSLEGETQDALDALELVKAEKPLRSLGKMAAGLHVVNKHILHMPEVFSFSCRLLLRQRGPGVLHQRGHQVVCHCGLLCPRILQEVQI